MALRLEFDLPDHIHASSKRNSMTRNQFISDFNADLEKSDLDGEVTVSLHSYDGSGRRIPFSVITQGKRYIAKTYDLNNKNTERAVLQKLNGFRAPIPRLLGEHFIIEELVHFSCTLRHLFDTDDANAIGVGAEHRAVLARKEVFLTCDNNWMQDLVYSGDNGWKCIDFGHGKNFFNMGENKEIDKIAKALNNHGDKVYLVDYAGAPYVRPYNDREDYELHKSALEALLSLRGDNITKANIFLSIREAAYGLRDNFFNSPRYNGTGHAHAAIIQRLEYLVPIFIKEFVKIYNAPAQQ